MQEESLLFERFDVICFGEFSAAVSKGNLTVLVQFSWVLLGPADIMLENACVARCLQF